MAFRQHHRPQQLRQLSYHAPEQPTPLETAPSPQRKRPLEDSEEWVLFSPTVPSTTARTQTTSTERTPRTAGLSRFSDFGSLDTAARSDQDGDNLTCQGTDLEEEGDLDSLDDGLHAFHEPSEYSAPSRLIQSGETVLPTHDGLGTFQADSSTIQEQLWQFERSSPRRRQQRRRSSVQRRLDALEETEELDHEDNRRLRIEKWRLEQSKALLEEIERETRRRRRMSLVSAAKSSIIQEEQTSSRAKSTTSGAQQDAEDSSEESTENLSFWQRFTRRIIHDLMGIDDNLLSVIFGEALPMETTESASVPDIKATLTAVPRDIEDTAFPGEPWEHRLLERIARELGVLVHQLSEHPGAFSTYLRTQEAPSYAGIPLQSLQTSTADNSPLATTQSSMPSPTAAIFGPTLPNQTTTSYSEASLWGIEEEEETDLLESFRQQQHPTTAADDAARLQQDREYWERELDVKMVFNYLTNRFSSRPTTPTRRGPLGPQSRAAPSEVGEGNDLVSARRAALIRQHHPLVSRATSQQPINRRRDLSHRHHYHHNHTPVAPLRSPVLRSGSSCASHSTKKSKRSSGSGRNRNFWDMSGSIGSGSVVYGEV